MGGGYDTNGAMVLLGPKLVFNVVLSRSIESPSADIGGRGSWDVISAGHLGHSSCRGVINNQIGLHLPWL
jgi:hypothetical protein